MTIKCLMIGVGAYPFVDDWALAASARSRVYGMRSVTDQSMWEMSPVVVRTASGDIHRYEVHTRKIRGVRWMPRVAESVSRSAILAVVREIEKTEGPIDLIHSHFYAASAGVPSAAMALGIPYVHTEHSSRLVSSQSDRSVTSAGLESLRRVATGASRVFVVSESLLEAMTDRGIDARYEVLGNPVDASVFSVRRHTSSVVPARLVTIGSLTLRKRHELLIRAFARVVDFQPAAMFTIIGDGPLRMQLEALAADLGVASKIRFTGWIRRSAVAEELSRADAYIHGAVVETFGVSIVEALLSGIPVVSSACGGVLGAMPASLPVTVVDPASPEALADAIEVTLENVRALDRDAVAVAATRRFGLDSASGRLRDAYESAVLDQ